MLTFNILFFQAVKFMTNEVRIVFDPTASTGGCIEIDAISLIGSSVLRGGKILLTMSVVKFYGVWNKIFS